MRPFDVVVVTLTCLLGLLAFWHSGFLVLFIPLAYAVLLRAFFDTRRRFKDWVNPLCLILGIGFVRFGLPGLLLIAGVDPDIQTFRHMRLRDAQWLMGHVLALLGMLGVTLGWLLSPRRAGLSLGRTLREMISSQGVRFAAAAGMLVGFGGLLLFVVGNASLMDVLLSGEFRRTEIQVGTGKFFYVSFLLIASSVALSAALVASRPRIGWFAIVPVAVALVAFWPLGGRVRALVPCAAALLILWYRRRDLEPAFRRALIVASLGLPVVLYAGAVYRTGGGGLDGMIRALSIAEIRAYVENAVWVDWGQLHALAGAAAVGPGMLDGGSFLNALLWPLSEVYDFGGRNVGVFIVEKLVGFDGARRWGFHASLIGDAYVNFGLGAVLLATILFGIAMKVLYAAMREGGMNATFYVLAVVYSIRIFFESIERYPEALTVLVSVVLVTRVGQRLRFHRRTQAATTPRPRLVEHPIS